MKETLKVLLPTDFSPLSKVAVKYAVHLLDGIDAELFLFNSDDMPRPSYSFINKLDDIIKQEATEDMYELAEEVRQETGKAVHLEYLFTFGDPVTEINKCVKKKDFDLIIMGTKGEGEVQNKIFGSNAAGVMEDCTVPVLLVPENAEFEQPKDIVYATDLTNINREISELISFARLFDANLHALHIYPEVIDPNTFDDEKIKLQLIKRNMYDKITFNAMMDSDIIDGIERFVKENEFHFLAMYKHKSDLLEMLFDMSLSKEMALHNRVPLLVFQKEG